MPNRKQLAAARARQRLYQALRQFFTHQGYQEVETPVLIPTPGMETHITAFEVSFVPEMEGAGPRTLYLHTSPEYAMKRLLADGLGPIFQICKAFRNGEVSATHNPEFSLLEFYRPDADYEVIMSDLENALAFVQGRVTASSPFAALPYERLSVADAFRRHADIELNETEPVSSLIRRAEDIGVHVPNAESFEDVFFHVFLQKVEPFLGQERPTFLVDYPGALAALARIKPSNPKVAERFELYVSGMELANGFSELTDAAEQRRRLLDEQAQRRRAGRAEYSLDERFLEAVGRMPPSGGVALGLDRVLMLLLDERRIEDVLLFPARDFT